MHAGTTGEEGDDASGALISDLMRVHGSGFSGGLRALIVGDGNATRLAVVRHLGFPVLGGTCPGRTAPDVPPVQACRRRATLFRFLWTSISFALLLTSLGLIGVLLVVPKAVGAVPITILSGSMRPTMPPGTVVVVRPVEPHRIRIGDVVTYQATSDEPMLVTHRVTEVTRSPHGRLGFTLQGDNNDAPDQPVRPEQIRGRVIYAVPYFGWVTNRLNTGDGPAHTRWAAYALMGYGALVLGRGTFARIRTPRAQGRSARRRHAAGNRGWTKDLPRLTPQRLGWVLTERVSVLGGEAAQVQEAEPGGNRLDGGGVRRSVNERCSNPAQPDLAQIRHGRHVAIPAEALLERPHAHVDRAREP
ncbi:signal peptidase I [Nocardioides sp.]|jgi:signal peptidase|uniref:signal peptidase I n=1 Tax=Nocardioides sp. TaxID=35761 RepID=UPI0031FF448E|nr:putative signal peptidase [Nocardioides sp.]